MKKFDQINVIPFIDIMLVLLAIVLICATFIQTGKLTVVLPQASHSEAIADNAAKTISINAQGEISLDNQTVDAAQLSEAMQSWQKTQSILLRIDKASQFEHFVQVTDLLKKWQLTHIAIVTETP